jgi:hypothetical protein
MDEDKLRLLELEAEVRMKEALDIERECNKKLYAIKLVEVIVFGMVGFILLAVLGALVALVVIG